MFIYLYHLVWTFGVLIALPVFLLSRRGRFFERLTPKLSESPQGGSIWIHALSVGEAISAVPLVKRIKASYPERAVVFTATTSQGLAVARKELRGTVDHIVVMPLDFWWSVRRFVRVLEPDLFLLVETDLWPGLLAFLRKRGVNRILVNGRISPRTFNAYRRYAFFVRRMFETLELCLMQSNLDTERLLQVGVRPEKVLTAGNLKFDHSRASMNVEERRMWLERFHLTERDVLWTAGSTHRGEEKIILRVHKRVSFSFPYLRLVIAPRRIEEADVILELSSGMGLRAALRTHASDTDEPYDVLVLDTLGELERVYGLSEISFVGGSLVPVGGHNLLEPAGFGRPVLFGPHTHNFVQMSEMLSECGGGWRVADEEGLYKAVETLLGDPELRRRMGRHAERFVEENRGALDCVMAHISRFLGKG